MLAPALAETLRQRRDALNASFAAARRRWPHLAPADFSFFLREQLSPLVAAVAQTSPAHADTVATLGYELGLQLVAEKIAGPSAVGSTVNRLWRDVFPPLTPLLVPAPRHVLGSLCNAAHHLDRTPGTVPSLWLHQLAALGPRCTDAPQLLLLAQLLAWRAGLAHYRHSALAAGNQLPPPLALAALNAPATAAWTEVHAAHVRDPWFGHDLDGRPLEASSVERRVGGFRGFAGLFSVPPTVAVLGDNLLVRSGDEAWLLIADVFGATFHRVAPDESTTAASPHSPAAPSLPSRLPAGHVVTSIARLSHTFAFTSAQSHAVWIGPVASS